MCALSVRASGGPPQILVAGGVRWIGTAASCHAPVGWTTERLFGAAVLPGSLGKLCLYVWRGRDRPTPRDVADLFNVSGAPDLTEDVPVVVESAGFSAGEVALFSGLRAALRDEVGSAALLPSVPQGRAARVVVIDSAPDAAHGMIHPGTSRHGDTLAHLIEEVVCLPVVSDNRTCAAEVTTALALDGGVGTLSQLARAIERAVTRWQSDRSTAPESAPPRLILNLSLAWEDRPGVADCTTGSPASMAPPARAVVGILQYAAARGALIVAAAGNDVGGRTPPTGLSCPGRYQAVARDSDPRQPLVVAVSGVDYQDHHLDNARPLGIAGFAAVGLGGVAWAPADPVPPPLTGSSVSTAVVSAVGALVWSQKPAWAAAQVAHAVYEGGVEVGPADACPLGMAGCRSHRASTCGALHAAGVSTSCAPAAAGHASSPALPAENDALDLEIAALPVEIGTAALTVQPLPRTLDPTIQLQPWTYPTPVAETCPVCRVANDQLYVPMLSTSVEDPVLVVLYADASVQTVALAPQVPTTPPSLAGSTPYAFVLPPPPSPTAGPIVSAYLTALVAPPSLPAHSITEPMFVEP